jgi:hypothetical protein
MSGFLRRGLAGLVLLMAIPSVAYADAVKGIVVFDKGCGSRIIIETRLGYILAEWYGGNLPAEGDVLVGELNSYGFKDIYNLTSDASSRLYIDDYMMSRSRVTERLRDKCN